MVMLLLFLWCIINGDVMMMLSGLTIARDSCVGLCSRLAGRRCGTVGYGCALIGNW